MDHIASNCREFAEMLGARVLQEGKPEEPVSHLIIDSRLYRGRAESAFFAIRSSRNDGHRYVRELAGQGISYLILSRTEPMEDLGDYPAANVLLVDEAVAAMQRLAIRHRERCPAKRLAITGSNGKTVVKEWLYQLLHKALRVMRSPRSYNSQVGVALSLCLLRKRHQLAIIEAGISQVGEMEMLADMIAPQVGIFTNIGPAHQENFQSMEQKIGEKLKLFKGVAKLLYCRDHEAIHQLIDRTGSQLAIGKTLSWGRHSQADMQILAEELGLDKCLIRASYEGREHSIEIPFTDRASVENACHCWLYMLSEGYSAAHIAEGMSRLHPVAMRLEQLDGVQGSTLINDSYNSDFHSLELAIDQLMLQRKNPVYTAIISDIDQSAELENELYAKMAGLLLQKGVNRFIGIGESLCAYSRQFEGMDSRFFSNTEQFLEVLDHKDFAGQNILIKGGRRFAFERICDILSEKIHETVLEIDLGCLRHNLHELRGLLRPETEVMVMVKAFAYGSGAYEIARTLEYHGADYLAVAYADEGIRLREAGIKMRIVVLNPESSTYDAMIRYKLEPQIYSFKTLERFVRALEAREADWPYSVHIKINTGMNRLGFDLHELEELGEQLRDMPSLHIDSVFSHLAASDEGDFDSLTQKQFDRFEQGLKLLQKHYKAKFKTHILNSQGVFRFPEEQRDIVRLGLALYGVSSEERYRKNLQEVSRLYTTVSQVRHVAQGEGIGYNPKQMLKETTRIAVLPIGYADGLSRALGNGRGGVFIGGQRCPFVGNICMDMAMVDVNSIACQEGDQVEIFGDHISIYDIAKQMNTIPYEVLTSISERVKRIYLHQ